MGTSIFSRCLARVLLPVVVVASAANAVAARAQAAQQPQQTPQTPQKPAGNGAATGVPTNQAGPAKLVVPDHGSGIRSLNDQDIKLSPGDVIQIQVDNHSALDNTYFVPGVGKLLLPEAGEVTIAGYTITQVRDNLQTELDKTLNNVFVRVLLKEVHSRHVAITGVLARQGDFDMGTKEYRLLDLIDLAGGLLPPPARADAKLSEYTGTLYRGKVNVPLFIDDAYRQPDGDANFVVQPNDRVQIGIKPFVTHQMHILGEIPRQGNYYLDNNTTLLGLFGTSGFPSTAASLSTSYVIRGDKKIPLDLRPILTGKIDLEVNKFKFEDDDTLYIPKVIAKFMVWGQVGHQGNYPYPEAQKVYLLDAITGAGEAPSGEYRHVHLIRKINDKEVDKEINVDKMIRKGLMAENILIEPDDIIFVPMRHLRQPAGIMDGLNEVFQPLVMLSYFGLHPY